MSSIGKDPSACVLGALVLGASLLHAQTPAPPAAPAPPAPASPARQVFINQTGGGAAYLGVGLGEIDAERAKRLKLKEEYGVEVTRVDEDSPASKAGLKTGDVVLEYNGQRVEGFEQFARFVRETPVGREVKLTVSREGARQMLMVKVGTRRMRTSWAMNMPTAPVAPVAPVPPGEIPRPFFVWTTPRLGIAAESIDGQLGQFFGVKEGVLIRSVTAGSAAEKAGLKAGDVITKVDGSAVVSPADVTRAVRSAARAKKAASITVMRDKHETTITAKVEEGEDRSERHEFRMMEDSDGWRQQIQRIEDGVRQFQFEFPREWEGFRTVRSILLE